MFGLKEKECADLLEIVRRIIGDETEFEHMVAKTVNLSHNLSDKDISQQDVLDTCSEITKMICDYGLLLHILVELRKKGKINFNEGKQKEDLLNLIILIKKIQEKLLIVKQYLRREDVRENSRAYDQSIENYTARLKFCIDAFLRSEKETMEIITKDLNGGITFTEGKIKGIEIGQFRVEIHKRIKLNMFAGENSGLGDFLWGILVFDRDYLVAEAGLEDYRPGERMVVVYTQTYFSSRGYMQRAVEILLKSGLIKEWWSDRSTSSGANKMYWRLEKKNDFLVKREHLEGERLIVRYKVTLKNV